ncbi:unnamed protein product [Arabidopsis thaliana]|uniref:THH1/TOM1/TOM3 domain-containing protein n=1 Tax=Arabidopsis thaliana TaxID=3702 RepID=A0A5S9WLK9_ARATH|nr:unnamed protein product [Arabidopsis thaliana]
MTESTDGLKPIFFTINAIAYVVQISLWLLRMWKPVRVMLILSKMFLGECKYGHLACILVHPGR